LGHVDENAKIIMNSEQIKGIMEYPRPITARKIKQFYVFTLLSKFYQRLFKNSASNTGDTQMEKNINIGGRKSGGI
jgi:hypothetical protein